MADAAALAAELPIAPGQVLGERYRVGEVLGEGGMGIVCGGTHVLLGTPVAIKLIHSDLKQDPETVQRFMNEARAAAALKGEHIARVFDVGLLSTGEPYLVMEQLDGIGLDQYLLDRGALQQTEAVDIVLQACEGLAEAHAARLVHRDIKPANLFLARQANGKLSLKILDFGIAKQQVDEAAPGLTNPGKSLGSPWYMSPEQMLTPASVDERADVWSLGVLLFELLTGKRPFDGDTVPQVCAMVLTAAPPRVRDVRPEVDPELDGVVLHCLEKEPERRFASVSELSNALVRFASAPTHMRGIALDDGTPATSDAPPEDPESPSYGSLTPLAAGLGWVPPHPSWKRYVALLALPALALGGYWALRGSTSPWRAAAAGCLELPWDPMLLPTRGEVSLEREAEAPALLQGIHTARAIIEPTRPRVATGAVTQRVLASARAPGPANGTPEPAAPELTPGSDGSNDSSGSSEQALPEPPPPVEATPQPSSVPPPPVDLQPPWDSPRGVERGDEPPSM